MPDKTYNVLFICTGNSARSIEYRMLQLLQLPFKRLSDADLQRALSDISASCFLA